jgi:hypothetical protein
LCAWGSALCSNILESMVKCFHWLQKKCTHQILYIFSGAAVLCIYVWFLF